MVLLIIIVPSLGGEYEAVNKALQYATKSGREPNYDALQGISMMGDKIKPTYKAPCNNCNKLHQRIF